MRAKPTHAEPTARTTLLEQELLQHHATIDTLQENLARYTAVVDKAHDLIHTVTPEGAFLFTNNAWRETLGYSEEELKSLILLDIVDDSCRDKCRRVFTSLLKGESIDRNETLFVSKDGRKIPLEGRCSALLKDGKAVAMTGIFRDISQVKKAETNYQSIFNAANDAIAIHDAKNGHIIETNPRMSELYGYSSEEFRLLSVEELSAGTPPYTQREALTYIKKTKQEGPQLFKWLARHKAGHFFWVEVNLKLTMLDGNDCLMAMVRDISERKRAEEALRDSEQKYRTLFENMAQGVFYRRADGTYIDANVAALNIVGLTKEQFLGSTSLNPLWKFIREDGSIITDDQHPSMVALRTGQPVRNEIVGVFHPAKNKFVWLIINAIPQFKPEEQQPYQVFATVHDISERKLLEKTLQQGQEHLEHQVALRTQELHEANIALSVMLQRAQQESKHLEQRILHNLIDTLAPFLERLKRSGLRDSQKNALEIIEATIKEILAPTLPGMGPALAKLTTTEKTVANLVMQNKTSKEIGKLLDISPATVSKHRENIRKKMGVTNKKKSLAKTFSSPT
mgnify:CR=1 FL=1